MKLPIAIYPLFILADILDDIAVFAQLFRNRKNGSPYVETTDVGCTPAMQRTYGPDWTNFSIKDFSQPSPEMVKAAAEILYRLLFAITFSWGAGDIVDVDVQSEKEQVRVRCSLI